MLGCWVVSKGRVGLLIDTLTRTVYGRRRMISQREGVHAG